MPTPKSAMSALVTVCKYSGFHLYLGRLNFCSSPHKMPTYKKAVSALVTLCRYDICALEGCKISAVGLALKRCTPMKLLLSTLVTLCNVIKRKLICKNADTAKGYSI